VFWTRNPVPFLSALDRLEREGYRSIFQFTLTGFPRELEPSVPPFEEAVSAFRRLSERIGPSRVLWRFDPLLPGEPEEALAARFDRVSAALSGLTSRCTLSIAHPYRKSLRATRACREIWEPSERFRETVLLAAATGGARGFDVRSCCTPLLGEWGIRPAACVDGAYLRTLWPGADIPTIPSPSRAGCLCSASRDIGSYRTCRHGCVYCYAA
jgi:DNA repair photolyase